MTTQTESLETLTKPEEMTYDMLVRFFVDRGASLDACQDMGGAALREDYSAIYGKALAAEMKEAAKDRF